MSSEPTVCHACGGSGVSTHDAKEQLSLQAKLSYECFQCLGTGVERKPILERVRAHCSKQCSACAGHGKTGIFTQAYGILPMTCTSCKGSGQVLKFLRRKESFYGPASEGASSTCQLCKGTGRNGCFMQAKCMACSGSGNELEFLVAICYGDRTEVKFKKSSSSRDCQLSSGKNTSPSFRAEQEPVQPKALNGLQRTRSRSFCPGQAMSPEEKAEENWEEADEEPLPRRVVVVVPNESPWADQRYLGSVYMSSPLLANTAGDNDFAKISERARRFSSHLEQAFHYGSIVSESTASRTRDILYHGTDARSARIISSRGFQETFNGFFGPGVYVTDNPLKAALFAERRSEKRGVAGVVLELSVDLGKCKTNQCTTCERDHIPGCQCKAWREEGFDSQYVPGVAREETVIRDPRRLLVVDIIF